MDERNRTPAIIGFLVAGALVLAIGFFVDSRDAAAPADAVPQLRTLAPGSGDTVSNPVLLEFATAAPLRLSAAGWTAGDLHLHVMVDDDEIMPAAADIEARDSTYTWQLPTLRPGERRLFLTWAGRRHGNVDTGTDTLRIHVRP